MNRITIDLTNEYETRFIISDSDDEVGEHDIHSFMENTDDYESFVKGILDPDFLKPRVETPELRQQLNALIDDHFALKASFRNNKITKPAYHQELGKILKKLAEIRGDQVRKLV